MTEAAGMNIYRKATASRESEELQHFHHHVTGGNEAGGCQDA